MFLNLVITNLQKIQISSNWVAPTGQFFIFTILLQTGNPYGAQYLQHPNSKALLISRFATGT